MSEKSGACCSIGARPDAAAINAALETGEGLGTICKRFRLLAKSSLGVHRQRCLGITVQQASSTGSKQSDSEANCKSQATEATGNLQAIREDSGADAAPAVRKVARARPRAESPRPPARPGGVQATVQTVQEPTIMLSDDEHVQAIADQMADGLWVGRRSVREYANASGIRRGKVKDFARAAALACHADHDQIEQRRQPALGRWLRLYEDALDAEDWKAAAAALAGHDRAAGIAQPNGTRIQIQIGDSDFGRGCARFIQAVAPDAAPEFAAWCGAVQAGDHVARSDPAAWLGTRRRAIDTTAEATE